MGSVSEATPITLTSEERAWLESTARSTKTEHRTRLKAQIVLMAADGLATRAIARALGGTIGTASKWRCVTRRCLGLLAVRHTRARRSRIIVLGGFTFWSSHQKSRAEDEREQCVLHLVLIQRRRLDSAEANQNRGGYPRSRLRYPSDLTHEEGTQVKRPIPLAKRDGDKPPSISARSHERADVCT